MSSAILTAVLVVAGLGLAVGGLPLYRQGLRVLSGVLGGGLAFAGAALADTGLAVQIAAALAVGLASAVLARVLFVATMTVAGAATGLAAAVVLTGTSLQPLSNVVTPAVLVGVVAGATLAVLLRRAVVAVVSALWGALLVWVGVETQAVVDALVGLRLPAPPAWALGLALVGVLVQAAAWAYLNDYDERVRRLLADLREEGATEGPTPTADADEGEAVTDTWGGDEEQTTGTEGAEADTWSEDPDV